MILNSMSSNNVLSINNHFKTGNMPSIASLTLESESYEAYIIKLHWLSKANEFHSSCELEPCFHRWHPCLSDKH